MDYFRFKVIRRLRGDKFKVLENKIIHVDVESNDVANYNVKFLSFRRSDATSATLPIQRVLTKFEMKRNFPKLTNHYILKYAMLPKCTFNFDR